MTVVAFRDKLLAADSLCVRDKTRTGKTHKIHRVEKTRYCGDGRYALVGDMGEAVAIAEWWLAGGPLEGPMPSSKSDVAGTVIWIPDHGRPLMLELGTVTPLSRAPYYAWGSGADFALGAMAAGASALQAVEAAIKHCTTCGGPVRFLGE